MNFSFSLPSFLIFSLALILIFEGILYTAFPSTVKKVLESFVNYRKEKIRLLGLCFLVIGLMIIYILIKYVI